MDCDALEYLIVARLFTLTMTPVQSPNDIFVGLNSLQTLRRYQECDELSDPEVVEVLSMLEHLVCLGCRNFDSEDCFRTCLERVASHDDWWLYPADLTEDVIDMAMTSRLLRVALISLAQGVDAARAEGEVVREQIVRLTQLGGFDKTQTELHDALSEYYDVFDAVALGDEEVLDRVVGLAGEFVGTTVLSGDLDE
jgi:hypothetical protein